MSSHLFKKYSTYSDYLEAKNSGEFTGITYSIATFDDSNDVVVYFLQEAQEKTYGRYTKGTAADKDIAYWSNTTNLNDLISNFNK